MTEQLPVKVSWKIGNIELQYEGSEGFLKTELPKLFQEIIEIYKAGSPTGKLEQVATTAAADNSNETPLNDNKLELSLNTIATRMGVKSKPRKDLVLAACAYLTLVNGQATCSRKDISAAMKTATHLYNINYKKGLSQYIKTLVNEGALLERSTGVYAISNGKLTELRALIDK